MGQFARYGRQLVMDLANGVVSGFAELWRRRWPLVVMAACVGSYLLLLHAAGQ